MSQENELRTALRLILDCVDYTAGNCRLNEMVGAVLPKEILERANKALISKALSDLERQS